MTGLCWCLGPRASAAAVAVRVRDGGDGAEGDAPPAATFVWSCFQCFAKGRVDLAGWLATKLGCRPRFSRSLFDTLEVLKSQPISNVLLTDFSLRDTRDS